MNLFRGRGQHLEMRERKNKIDTDVDLRIGEQLADRSR